MVKLNKKAPAKNLWRVETPDGAPIWVRTEASIFAQKTGEQIQAGTVIEVQEEELRKGITYLKLSPERWVFDGVPGAVPTLCVRHNGDAGTKPTQPIAGLGGLLPAKRYLEESEEW